MKTHVEFRSDAFLPYEGEEDEIYPGRFGKRLAEFLHAGLNQNGFEAGEPFAEDWGWIVPISNSEFSLWIGVGNYDEYPEDGFLCFIEPHQPRIRKWLFWTIDTSERISALQLAMNRVPTANPAIRDVKWWTYDEFNASAG